MKYFKMPMSTQRLEQNSPSTAFRCSTAGSATRCFRAHWRFVLTTPTCRCPGGDRDVSTDREIMAASPSASQEPGRHRDRDRGLVVLGQQRFTAWIHSLVPLFPHHSISARTIIISPGSISTDRSATSSSSSDKGLWLADRQENSFQLQREEEV